MNETRAYTARWQPIMLILDRRLDCSTCGAVAIFLTATVSEDDRNILEKADTWCFACYCKHQEEEE